MALSSNGMYIATETEQGTLIQVHLVSEATKSYNFWRATYPSTIYSLSFGPSTQLPDVLIATSSSGPIHCLLFEFGHKPKNLLRSKRSSSFLGSVFLDSVSDALDPAHHCVLQNAVSSGIRSHAVVRKIDKLEETSSPSLFTSLRATVSVIIYNGYFQEYYTLSINDKSESLWTLERESNLFSMSP